MRMGSGVSGAVYREADFRAPPVQGMRSNVKLVTMRGTMFAQRGRELRTFITAAGAAAAVALATQVFAQAAGGKEKGHMGRGAPNANGRRQQRTGSTPSDSRSREYVRNQHPATSWPLLMWNCQEVTPRR
jgi:hypothetical protein